MRISACFRSDFDDGGADAKARAEGLPNVAIACIHGHADALTGFLQLVEARPGDSLVFLGDYVSRGPDSREMSSRYSIAAGAHVSWGCGETRRRCSLMPGRVESPARRGSRSGRRRGEGAE